MESTGNVVLREAVLWHQAHVCVHGTVVVAAELRGQTLLYKRLFVFTQ